MNYRQSSIYVSNKCRFYLSLKAKQVVQGTAGKRTEDETADCDLINLYEMANPEWVLLWDKRETLKQKYKKDLQKIENEAIGLSPELEVNAGLSPALTTEPVES